MPRRVARRQSVHQDWASRQDDYIFDEKQRRSAYERSERYPRTDELWNDPFDHFGIRVLQSPSPGSRRVIDYPFADVGTLDESKGPIEHAPFVRQRDTMFSLAKYFPPKKPEVPEQAAAAGAARGTYGVAPRGTYGIPQQAPAAGAARGTYGIPQQDPAAGAARGTYGIPQQAPVTVEPRGTFDIPPQASATNVPTAEPGSPIPTPTRPVYRRQLRRRHSFHAPEPYFPERRKHLSPHERGLLDLSSTELWNDPFRQFGTRVFQSPSPGTRRAVDYPFTDMGAHDESRGPIEHAPFVRERDSIFALAKYFPPETTPEDDAKQKPRGTFDVPQEDYVSPPRSFLEAAPPRTPVRLRPQDVPTYQLETPSPRPRRLHRRPQAPTSPPALTYHMLQPFVSTPTAQSEPIPLTPEQFFFSPGPILPPRLGSDPPLPVRPGLMQVAMQERLPYEPISLPPELERTPERRPRGIPRRLAGVTPAPGSSARSKSQRIPILQPVLSEPRRIPARELGRIPGTIARRPIRTPESVPKQIPGSKRWKIPGVKESIRTPVTGEGSVRPGRAPGSLHARAQGRVPGTVNTRKPKKVKQSGPFRIPGSKRWKVPGKNVSIRMPEVAPSLTPERPPLVIPTIEITSPSPHGASYIEELNPPFAYRSLETTFSDDSPIRSFLVARAPRTRVRPRRLRSPVVQPFAGVRLFPPAKKVRRKRPITPDESLPFYIDSFFSPFSSSPHTSAEPDSTAHSDTIYSDISYVPSLTGATVGSPDVSGEAPDFDLNVALRDQSKFPSVRESTREAPSRRYPIIVPRIPLTHEEARLGEFYGYKFRL